jgi:hypothetical protein
MVRVLPLFWRSTHSASWLLVVSLGFFHSIWRVIMLIEVEIKSVYGKNLYYPINDKAHILSHIAGTETLTERTLQLATDMGMTVKAHYTFPKEVLPYAT